MVDAVGSQILAEIETSNKAKFPDMGEVELECATKRVTEKFSETLHIIGNEPSLALYRLQEHVRKTLPTLVENRIRMENLEQAVQGMCYDAEYASSALTQMQNSNQHFNSIDEHLNKALYLKQELNKAKSKQRHSSISEKQQKEVTPSAASLNQTSSSQDKEDSEKTNEI
ncbi:BLOC-1-related complex subunit 8-like [Ptychodera flava]|uniref:BLOC-1-related complex subunit 8-like n=1 Tax=Ptychodera flava TaxID=63121 RepID=UPI00396A9F57